MRGSRSRRRRLLAAWACSAALHGLVILMAARTSWVMVDEEPSSAVSVVWVGDLRTLEPTLPEPQPELQPQPQLQPQPEPELQPQPEPDLQPQPEPEPLSPPEAEPPDSEMVPKPRSAPEPPATEPPPSEPTPSEPPTEPPPSDSSPPDTARATDPAPTAESERASQPPPSPDPQPAEALPPEPETAPDPAAPTPAPEAPPERGASEPARSFVVTESALEEAWRRAMEELAQDEEYLTFSLDDVTEAPAPEEPGPPTGSLFEEAEKFRGSGGPSVLSPRNARTRVGRAIAELCNALTGGFGIGLNGFALGSACADPGESAKLFAHLKPAYLRSRPVCTEVEPVSADGAPTIKCRLVLEEEMDQIEVE